MPQALSHVYYNLLTAEDTREIDKVFRELMSADPVIHNQTLNTCGRTITISESMSKIAKFGFNKLCSQPLSAADYLEVMKKFGMIFMLDVPKMGLDSKDKARRFIMFIDGLWYFFV
ncbi:Lactation elevated protein 1 like protein [Termitomyces sp. J132]|nr:Lactation elevated protein 1 like protein [Termitomyces sp. J132]